MTLKINYQYAHAKMIKELKTNECGLTIDNGEIDNILRSATLLEDFTYTTKNYKPAWDADIINPVLLLKEGESISYDNIKIPVGSTIWFLKNKYYDMHNEEILVKFEDILYWEDNNA